MHIWQGRTIYQKETTWPRCRKSFFFLKEGVVDQWVTIYPFVLLLTRSFGSFFYFYTGHSNYGNFSLFFPSRFLTSPNIARKRIIRYIHFDIYYKGMNVFFINSHPRWNACMRVENVLLAFCNLSKVFVCVCVYPRVLFSWERVLSFRKKCHNISNQLKSCRYRKLIISWK